MLLLVFPQETCTSENLILFYYRLEYHSVCTKMFQATFWNNHKTCTFVPTTEEKACGISPFFLFLQNFHLPTNLYSFIRIFNSRLVSNKNILSISIFNNVIRFEIYTRSVHCTLVHCRSWTQCDHGSLPFTVGRIQSHSDLSLKWVTAHHQTVLHFQEHETF